MKSNAIYLHIQYQTVQNPVLHQQIFGTQSWYPNAWKKEITKIRTNQNIGEHISTGYIVFTSDINQTL